MKQTVAVGVIKATTKKAPKKWFNINVDKMS
jgi:hypothetical protein